MHGHSYWVLAIALLTEHMNGTVWCGSWLSLANCVAGWCVDLPLLTSMIISFTVWNIIIIRYQSANVYNFVNPPSLFAFTDFKVMVKMASAIIIKIIICKLITTCAMSGVYDQIWGAGSCQVGGWVMCNDGLCVTKQVGFELVFESLHSWSISYGSWDFIPNLGGTIAEGTPTKVSCYSWNIVQLLTGRAQGSRGLIRKQKWTQISRLMCG